MDVQGAAFEFHVKLAPGKVVEHAGNRNGACAGAAGKGFARAAFPHAHSHLGGGDHFHKFGVGALRKQPVVLKAGADLGQIKVVYAFHEHNRMRVAHGNSGNIVASAVNLDRAGHKALGACVALDQHGNVGRGQHGFAHINRSAANLAAF